MPESTPIFQFSIFNFQLKITYIASTAISVTLMIFFDLRIGLAILGASVGTFSLLRSRVYPRFSRGPLLREENVSYPTTYRQLPTARLMGEWGAYHEGQGPNDLTKHSPSQSHATHYG